MNTIVGVVGAFSAGLATSVGPCAAPRYLTLMSRLTSMRGTRRAVTLATFVVGVVTTQLLLALIGGAAATVLALTHVLYWGLALSFTLSGLAITVVRRGCTRHATNPASRGTFLAAVSSGVTLSPCCTPLAVGLGMGAASGSAGGAVLSLVAFTVGHVTPVLTLGASCSMLMKRLSASGTDALATLAGACSIALGISYGISA
jgi:cytochrome c biogenesis protein CcdA